MEGADVRELDRSGLDWQNWAGPAWYGRKGIGEVRVGPVRTGKVWQKWIQMGRAVRFGSGAERLDSVR